MFQGVSAKGSEDRLFLFVCLFYILAKNLLSEKREGTAGNLGRGQGMSLVLGKDPRLSREVFLLKYLKDDKCTSAERAGEGSGRYHRPGKPLKGSD